MIMCLLLIKILNVLHHGFEVSFIFFMKCYYFDKKGKHFKN